MPNRLADAVSPYLRSHADNPVNWQQWGPEAFAEAERRQVPVLISIGYSTCHWCHVMARESFSDLTTADYLNESFVSIKVDREEFPDVDSTYMAAAGAFTSELGWPLTVFATPTGKAFYAGTYYPPAPVPGRPSFRQVLAAVLDAWHDRREEAEANADDIAKTLTARSRQAPGALPTGEAFAPIVAELARYEDTRFGGFGGAPKFPVAPVLGFLLEREAAGGADAADAAGLARRMLEAMAASELRDPVEGGFFRYAVRRDWSEPHYERMLYDNAQLLRWYADSGQVDVADGIASFLLNKLRLPEGTFASAQDSESTVDGTRVEGGYYALDADARSRQVAPALDDKILTGWNGLAIEALAAAGTRLHRSEWVDAARLAATQLGSAVVVRARVGDMVSSARPTLEDYGMLASGLLELGLATGELAFFEDARALVSDSMGAATRPAADEVSGEVSGEASGTPSRVPFGVPGGADPVLTGHGLLLEVDPSEGAYPSGLTAMADAARKLYLLTGDGDFLAAANAAMALLAPLALQRPISFGAALRVMSALDAGSRQLVVIADGSEEPTTALVAAARSWRRSGAVASVVTARQAKDLTAAGFELYAGRTPKNGRATAYLCVDFACRLPVTSARELLPLLS